MRQSIFKGHPLLERERDIIGTTMYRFVGDRTCIIICQGSVLASSHVKAQETPHSRHEELEGGGGGLMQVHGTRSCAMIILESTCAICKSVRSGRTFKTLVRGRLPFCSPPTLHWNSKGLGTVARRMLRCVSPK